MAIPVCVFEKTSFLRMFFLADDCIKREEEQLMVPKKVMLMNKGNNLIKNYEL